MIYLLLHSYIYIYNLFIKKVGKFSFEKLASQHVNIDLFVCIWWRNYLGSFDTNNIIFKNVENFKKKISFYFGWGGGGKENI